MFYACDCVYCAMHHVVAQKLFRAKMLDTAIMPTFECMYYCVCM